MRSFIEFLLSLLLIAALGVCCVVHPTVAEFATSRELSDFLTSRGFSLQHGHAPPGAVVNFIFSDHVLADEDAADLSCCTDCGLTPKWKGVVRVNQIHSSIGSLVTTSIGGNTRIWGNLLLAGDDELIERVLEAVREDAPQRIR